MVMKDLQTLNLKFDQVKFKSYGFLITNELIFGFQILDLKDHFSASLTEHKGKPGKSSVNRLLNNPSIVNPLQLKDIMEVDSL